MELIFLALLIVMLALALGSGYPVAFALPGAAILTISIAGICGYLFAGDMDAFFAQDGPSQWLSAGVTNLRGIYWEVERDTLIAIPLFIFMGIMLQRSKIAEDLLVTMAQLFGPVPGGLGISVVFVGALLAATTGIVGATVVAMGLISLPVMLRNNYSQSLATGTIAASGTLGQIIPPSIVLIILADQLASATDQAGTARTVLYKASTGEISMPSEFAVTSTSAGEMFLGALFPGLVLVGLYMLYILVYAMMRPANAPAVPYEGDYDKAFWGTVLNTLVPPLVLIFMVLGSIISGIATVNQAGAIGAAGALLMAGYRLKDGKGKYAPALLALVGLIGVAIALAMFDTNVKNIRDGRDMFGLVFSLIVVAILVVALIWSGIRVARIDDTLRGVMIETAKATSLVFIILLGAAMLTAAFRAFGGEELVKEFLNSLPGGFWMKFVIVMAVIFVLGFFLDFIEIAVVVVPIVAPILLADPGANITAVWLGVMIGLNIQTSFLTPPFGFALFYLRGVAPAIVKTINMYKGVIAFICLQLIALAIVGYYPPLVNYLPNRLSMLSDTAPPPRNPKLQYCLEEFVSERLVTEASSVEAAIGKAASIDTSLLPKKIAKEFSGSIDDAREALEHISAIKVAEASVFAASDAYRPLHTQVRQIERDMRTLSSEIEELETLRRRASETRAASLATTIEKLQQEKVHLESMIPEAWAAERDAFSKLVKDEQSLRNKYRKAADNAYQPVVELQGVLMASESLAAMDGKIAGIRAEVEAKEPEELLDPLRSLSNEFGGIDGAKDIKSAVSKARSALKAKRPSQKKALAALDKAQKAYDEQMSWLQQARDAIGADITNYEEALRQTLGVRSQPRMSREQALYVASCSSVHRDLSLKF